MLYAYVNCCVTAPSPAFKGNIITEPHIRRNHISGGRPVPTRPVMRRRTVFGKDQRMPTTGYISYPTLSASLTHYIRQWVCIFMSMHAYYRAFSTSRADTLMYFPRNRGEFEQVVLLAFALTFNTLCRIKIISFCSFKKKNGKIILRY